MATVAVVPVRGLTPRPKGRSSRAGQSRLARKDPRTNNKSDDTLMEVVMKALAGKNQISYGGDGGSFNAVQDTGGQQVVIKSGSKIDSIQIGNNKYGGGAPSG
ncbi:hypothetical protein ALQ63_01059 [Serratia plymuthica]|nr:hypothetical protein ALQ63_01059 [Serratia plymuthica]